VAELASTLGVPAAVCVNKADINPSMAGRVESVAMERGLAFVGRVPYDEEVTRAQVEGRSVVEISGGAAGAAIRGVWSRVEETLTGG